MERPRVCLYAVSFVKKPDFHGPKQTQNAPHSDGLKRLGNREEALQSLQDSFAHPQYAAWAKMMTAPDEYRQMPSTA